MSSEFLVSDPPSGLMVHVLMISHKYGTDFWVCQTEEIALKKLDEFVQNWWDDEMDDAEMPATPEERSQQYFEHVENESFQIGSSLLYTE